VNLLLRLTTLFFALLGFQSSAIADPLDLVLTQGAAGALPIAIVPFAGQDDAQAPNNISSVVMADLKNSGQFKVSDPQSMTQTPHAASEVNDGYWRKTANVDNVVVGKVKSLGGDRYQVSFALLDVVHAQDQNNNSVLSSNSFTVSGDELRALAHHISDIIYQQLTGVRGIFSTQIAYVLVQRNPGAPAKFTLEVADADGYNPRTLVTSNQPIMSPAWSHDGKRLAYVSFENVTPQIFIQEVVSGARHAVSNFPGINGAPAWSPNNNKLAIVLSKGGGNSQIYVMDLNGGALQQVTHDDAINTEPSWSPDGKSLIFTSDRSGGMNHPQIYQTNLAGGGMQRLTYKGNYNARASFSPDGRNIVMINHQNGYNIALQNLASGTVLMLTDSGNNTSPSIAPNGKMVLYEMDMGQQGVLGMASTDGRVKLRLPAPNGSVQDPAWSPFLAG
jgi:TolB protein